MFVAGDRVVIGYRVGVTEREVRAALQGREPTPNVMLPIVGTIDPSRISWVEFTLLLGLVDGITPAARSTSSSRYSASCCTSGRASARF